MSKTYSLEEQHRYIEKDFQNRVVVPCGSIPETSFAEADKWWDKQIPIWNAWLKRYEKSEGRYYAHCIWNEYMNIVERIYSKLAKRRKANESNAMP